MANKVENMTWLELVDEYNLKDNGLKNVLRDYAEARPKEEYDLALKSLATLAKLGTDLKNSKEAKAAGPDVIKRIGKLIDGIAVARKEWEKKKAEKAKEGCQQDVQIVLERWDGKSMYGCWAKVELASVGGTTIKRELSIPGTILKINDVFLQPKGSLGLSVFQLNDLYCQGTADFKFTPGKDKDGLKFRFTQDSKKVKVKAKTMEEVTKKLGLKAEASLEIKVLKVGGEVSKETEYKEGFEKEVEWEIEMGAEKFRDAKLV